jgi:hypothetical protein
MKKSVFLACGCLGLLLGACGAGDEPNMGVDTTVVYLKTYPVHEGASFRDSRHEPKLRA